MATKWVQSAHYPPSAPKVQSGRTAEENDADHRRMQQARKRNLEGQRSQHGRALK